MKVRGFVWDEGNIGKCQKHGVSIGEIEYVFKNDISVYPDVKHSEQEIRYFAVGVNRTNKHVFIVFTYRSKHIRPISARYMHKKEVDNYKKLVT